MRKPTRTISGVTPLAVMLPPRPCPHGTCIFCPTLEAPQSYTPKSPVVMRAAEVNFDAAKQVKDRLAVLESMGHPTDKIELIIMGGTFLGYPKDFQYKYIKDIFDALNKKPSSSLEEAKSINETAKHRCIALCIETRPDFCTPEQIKDMLSFGCTRVELGVQILDDKIYKLVHRGHSVKDVIDATYRLKQAGFKIGYHLMPGLPGSSLDYDIKLFKKVFSDEEFKPDQIKIYPCQVLKGALLEKWFNEGKYTPYSEEETKSLILAMLKSTPRYCRVMRIMREIPPAYLVAGVSDISLRHKIEEELRKNKIRLHEIRSREIGILKLQKKKITPNVTIKIYKYHASKGIEFFIEAVNPDKVLFGLARLRLENNTSSPAMVRELHVYGQALSLGKKEKSAAQHQGLGHHLMHVAEILARKYYKTHIRVISGVGVREYYRKIGYSLDDCGYMVKVI